MATSGRGRARERGRRRKKSVRKKRFAYYVGFRTWSVRPSDDPSATLPRWRSRREGRGSPDALCGGICTSLASADRFQHLNAQRRREKRRGEESDFPDFPFSGQKVASIPIHSIARRPFARSPARFVVSQLLQNCIIHLTFERRRATCAQKRENDITLARDGRKQRKAIKLAFKITDQLAGKEPTVPKLCQNFLNLARSHMPELDRAGHMHLIMQPKGRDR